MVLIFFVVSSWIINNIWSIFIAFWQLTIFIILKQKWLHCDWLNRRAFFSEQNYFHLISYLVSNTCMVCKYYSRCIDWLFCYLEMLIDYNQWQTTWDISRKYLNLFSRFLLQYWIVKTLLSRPPLVLSNLILL